MEIITQTDTKLILKDGNSSGVIMGIIVFIFGVFLGYVFLNSFVSKIVIVVALFLLIIGLLLILFSSAIIIDFDKINNQFNYIKKSLIKTKINIYNFADVASIETRKQWQTETTSYGEGNSSRINRITSKKVLLSQSIIILKDGTELPISHKKDSSNGSGLLNSSSVLMGGVSKEIVIANQVATFLNVPFREVTPPNEEGVINLGSINKIKF